LKFVEGGADKEEGGVLKYGVPNQVKGFGLIKTLILKTLGKGWLMINQRAREEHVEMH